MSHCGPLTAYFFMSKISLRICTPLLPLPPARRTWKLSSKSPYFFLLHRKVLNLMPSLPVSPMRATSDDDRPRRLTDQYSGRPYHPARTLAVKNAGVHVAVALQARP